MTKENNFDPVVLLLLFGLYFIMSFISEKNIPELLYGIVLIFYYVKCKFVLKNNL